MKVLLFLKKNKIHSYKNPSKLLIIRLNKVGDALVTTPLIHKIKVCTSSEIYVLADEKNHFVFENNPDIKKIIVLKRGITSLGKTKKLIDKIDIDLIIDSHWDVSTTVSFLLAKLTNRYIIGFEKENKKLYSKTITYKKRELHISQQILQLADFLNCKVYQHPELLSLIHI